MQYQGMDAEPSVHDRGLPGRQHDGEEHDIQGTARYLLVKIGHSNETMLCRLPTQQPELTCGDTIVVPTRYGNDLARVLGRIRAENSQLWEDAVDMVRVADTRDIEMELRHQVQESEAFDLCRERIIARDLDMKLVSVHFMLEEPRILFFFTSENRVDFRELVKDLVSVYHQRIELRQIGVRDESRLVGGQAVCGRALCCNTVSDRLQSVSIKMAKIQNLSINSVKISGPCGRLLCCLAYEFEAYKSERKDMPSEGMYFSVGGKRFVVDLINVPARLVYLRGENGVPIGVPSKYFRHDGTAWVCTESSLEDLEDVVTGFERDDVFGDGTS